MHCCTAVLGEEKAKLRDWAFLVVKGRLLLSGIAVVPPLETAVWDDTAATNRNQWIPSIGGKWEASLLPSAWHFPFSLPPSIIESSPVSGRRGERQCGRALRVSVGCRIRWKPQKGPKGNITYHHISFEAETYLGFKHTVRGPVSSQAGAGILCVFPSLFNKKGYLDFFRQLLSASF